jgi:hypothetical protein
MGVLIDVSWINNGTKHYEQSLVRLTWTYNISIYVRYRWERQAMKILEVQGQLREINNNEGRKSSILTKRTIHAFQETTETNYSKIYTVVDS